MGTNIFSYLAETEEDKKILAYIKETCAYHQLPYILGLLCICGISLKLNKTAANQLSLLICITSTPTPGSNCNITELNASIGELHTNRLIDALKQINASFSIYNQHGSTIYQQFQD